MTTTRGDLDAVLEDVAFVPERVAVSDVVGARRALERDGAVVVHGSPAEPDALVRTAAAVLGTRLRRLEEVRTRTTDAGAELPMHTDGVNLVLDVHGRHTRVRDHDVDYVLVQCDVQAAVGGGSFTADGYRLVDRIRRHRPDLYEFLTGVDVDFTSGVAELAALHQPPRVCRMVEWTRGGRRVVRAFPWAVPVPLDPRSDEHRRLLDEYSELLTALSAVAPDHLLQPGDIELLDSYRCPHGVRRHDGTRRTRVLSCTSAAAL